LLMHEAATTDQIVYKKKQVGITYR